MRYTPTTHPDRFTEEEAALFNAGQCGWVVEDGNWRGVIHCGKPMVKNGEYGFCREHERRAADEGR